MARRLGPAFGGIAGLDRIADIFAIGGGCMAKQLAFGAIDRGRISAIRPRLFAADIEFRRPVQRIGWVPVFGGEGFDFLERFGRAFWLGIACQPFPAAFAPETAFAHAPETGGGVHHIGAVDPHDASGQFWRDIKGKVDVFGPDRGRQSIAGVICNLDRFGWGAEGCGDQHRAKDFFLHQRGCGCQPRDQCGRIEAALWCCGLIDLAFGIGADHLADLRVLHRVDDGAHVDAFVQRITDAQPVHTGLEFGIEPLSDPFLHQQARSCAADLTLIEPDCIDQPFNG